MHQTETKEVGLVSSLAYWTFNYRPHWEAASKEMQALSSAMQDRFQVHLFSFSFREPDPCYLGRNKRLPLPHGFALLPWLAQRAGRFAINHLFASPAERFLAPRLIRTPAVITCAKDCPSLNEIERNADTLRKFRFVVVESERHRELLRQLRVPDDSIKLIYPGVRPKPYTPPEDPFRILFATSPIARHRFLTRGIYLILRVAQRLPEIRFVLVWRRSNEIELRRLLQESGVRNVEVRSGYIEDMDSVYRSVHATILPGAEVNSFKPCPHSGLESLAHGRPILVSRPTSIAPIVKQTDCGVVFEPTEESLESAILQLRRRYDDYQRNCHPTVEKRFSPDVFLARYQRLYEAML